MPDLFDWPKLIFAVGVPLALVVFVVVYVFKVLIPRMMDGHSTAQARQAEVFAAAMAEQRTDLLNLLREERETGATHVNALAGIFERRLDRQIEADREANLTLSEDLKSVLNALRELSQLVVFNVRDVVRRDEEERPLTGGDREREGTRRQQGRHGEREVQ